MGPPGTVAVGDSTVVRQVASLLARRFFAVATSPDFERDDRGLTSDGRASVRCDGPMVLLPRCAKRIRVRVVGPTFTVQRQTR